MRASLSGLFRAILDAKDDLEWRDRVADLQTAVFGLQEENFALQLRVRELDDELRQEKARHNKEQDFPLRCVKNGVFVRVGRSSADPAEPVHGLCPQCFAEGKESVLYPGYKTLYGNTWLHLACSKCKSNYDVDPSLAVDCGLTSFR